MTRASFFFCKKVRMYVHTYFCLIFVVVYISANYMPWPPPSCLRRRMYVCMYIHMREHRRLRTCATPKKFPWQIIKLSSIHVLLAELMMISESRTCSSRASPGNTSRCLARLPCWHFIYCGPGLWDTRSAVPSLPCDH